MQFHTICTFQICSIYEVPCSLDDRYGISLVPLFDTFKGGFHFLFQDRGRESRSALTANGSALVPNVSPLRVLTHRDPS